MYIYRPASSRFMLDAARHSGWNVHGENTSYFDKRKSMTYTNGNAANLTVNQLITINRRERAATSWISIWIFFFDWIDWIASRNGGLDLLCTAMWRRDLSAEMHTPIERFFVNSDRLWRERERPNSSTSSSPYCPWMMSFLTRLIPRNLLLGYQ